MTNIFEELTEEEKWLFVYSFAIMCAQNVIHSNETNLELDVYKNELKSMIDWIKPKAGLQGAPMYRGDPDGRSVN